MARQRQRRRQWICRRFSCFGWLNDVFRDRFRCHINFQVRYVYFHCLYVCLGRLRGLMFDGHVSGVSRRFVHRFLRHRILG